ncbi:MAG: hypothetical protein KKD29_06365 [Candidatus Omnitrophica bacterium]|nr:hypothetical protein [Candidatus Omnitrophota bacterium]MBU4487718.1 hypothetical protein [Candidatus Omnitrophota bacterium]MCG2705258.1 hypothetical protein [Candidatus Omnitrophota bacterium]
MNNEKLHCCEKCQIFWTCETKWYRGERSEENICCAACNSYRDCLSPKRSNKKSKVR